MYIMLNNESVQNGALEAANDATYTQPLAELVFLRKCQISETIKAISGNQKGLAQSISKGGFAQPHDRQ